MRAIRPLPAPPLAWVPPSATGSLAAQLPPSRPGKAMPLVLDKGGEAPPQLRLLLPEAARLVLGSCKLRRQVRIDCEESTHAVEGRPCMAGHLAA